MNDTVAGIEHEAVTAWILEHVADISAPLAFTLIAGGHSNLTYRFVDAAGRAGVLRRPPLGHVLESAHDMSREHRIVSALQGSAVPVAKTLGLCEDPAVNQAPFYLMDFVEGAVLHDADAARHLSAAEKISLGHHVIDVLDLKARFNPMPTTPSHRERNKRWHNSPTLDGFHALSADARFWPGPALSRTCGWAVRKYSVSYTHLRAHET